MILNNFVGDMLQNTILLALEELKDHYNDSQVLVTKKTRFSITVYATDKIKTQ